VTQARSWILIAIASVSCASARAGDATYVKNGSISLTSLKQKHAECQKHGLDVPAPASAVNLFKVWYKSVDLKGRPTTLSGLLMLPKAAPKGLVLYYHGTIRDRDLAPSRYVGKNGEQHLEAEFVMVAFAAGGYAVVMPDYLGLGDSQCVHPYPNGEANCRSGMDIIEPARSVAKRQRVPVGKNLYVTGYSEGGGVAMCTVRSLERSRRLIPTMAAPMSGPYDLSGETAQSLLRGNQSPEGLGTKLFLLAYASYSALNNLNQIDLKDYFAPSFATYVPYVFGLKMDDVGMAKKFVVKALQMGALKSIDRVLSKPFRDALKWSDPANPIIAEMKKSDCFDWTPKTKMLLPYLKGDGVVVDTNTTKTIDSMRMNGVGADRLRPYMIEGKGLSHSTAAPIAFSAVRRFFDGGFASAFAGKSSSPAGKVK
jgi:pimeloyl-ACP methyl ester carboxylesterase